MIPIGQPIKTLDLLPRAVIIGEGKKKKLSGSTFDGSANKNPDLVLPISERGVKAPPLFSLIGEPINRIL